MSAAPRTPRPKDRSPVRALPGSPASGSAAYGSAAPGSAASGLPASGSAGSGGPLFHPSPSAFFRTLLRSGLGAALWLSLALPAAAHDMWVEPSTFRPSPGEVLQIRLLVGHPGGEARLIPRDESRLLRFSATSAGHEEAILGIDGGKIAGVLRPEKEGLWVIGYHTTPLRHYMSSSDFDRYLEEEGLERIHALPRRQEQGDARVLERYSRSLKSLVAVGNPGETTPDAALGLPLEIVAGFGPTTEPAGSGLNFRVLFEGEPIEGLLVRARSLDSPELEVSTRSAGDGGATLELSRGGGWIVTAVHMRATPEGSEESWESFWASLSLELSP